jgi:KDO2-lipid IV(A) lauroyltransferase
MKKIRYFIEFLLVAFFMNLSVMLGAERASHLGGWIARHIGPFMSVNRKAKRHLNKVFPEYTDNQIKTILIDMWDNLGRNFLEYPHLKYLGEHHVKIINGDQLTAQLERGGPTILICGHFANWEVAAPAFLTQYNFEMDLIYRAPNNPWVDTILQKHRSLHGALKTYPKSKTGMRGVVDALSKKRHIGILIDQKYNGGVEANFFGYSAMTSPAFVQLSQKYKCPILTASVKRLGRSCHFEVMFHAPIDSSNREIIDVVTEANQFLEGIIRNNPAQWIWLHRRWRAF